MISTIFALIAVAEAVLLVSVFRIGRRRYWPALLLILVIAALIWDNAVIAAGRAIGAGPLLESLSVPRFVTHALLVPLLIMVGVGLGRDLGVRWLGGRGALLGFGALTVLMIGLGVRTVVLGMDLEPTRYADTLRYTDTAAGGPPIPAVVAIWVLIVIGVMVRIRARWPWMLAGSVAMLAAAGAGFAVPWLGNLGELLLAVSLWRTAAHRPADLGEAEPEAAASGKVGG